MNLPLITPNKKLGVFIALATSALFGLGPPLSRAAYNDGANFVLVALVTMFCRGFFLVCYCKYRGLKLFASRTTLKTTVSGAFFHALGMAALFGALVYLKGPLALMILYIFPLGLLFFLVWRGEARLSPLIVALVLMALAGLSLVLQVWEKHGDMHWGGVALAFLAAFGVAARMYIHGKQLEYRIPSVVGAENFIVAFSFTLLLVVWKAPILPTTTDGFMWVGLCGLAMGIGSLWAFYGMALTGSFTWSLLGKVEPVYAALFGALFFGEYLTMEQYIGMAVVLGSLALYQFASAKEQPKSLEDRAGKSG